VGVQANNSRREEVTMMAGAKNEAGAEVLSDGERQVIGQLLEALRSLRYGSVVFTVHDGQVVEIEKTERIRTNRPK
jgi:hypothetical protein